MGIAPEVNNRLRHPAAAQQAGSGCHADLTYSVLLQVSDPTGWRRSRSKVTPALTGSRALSYVFNDLSACAKTMACLADPLPLESAVRVARGQPARWP
jgi:hypothetical protein